MRFLKKRSWRAQLASAERALAAGDIKHAAHHAEAAIVLSPTAPEVYDFLMRLGAHPEGGSQLFPVVDVKDLSLGRCVAAAHVHAAEGNLEGGLILLLNAQEFDPEGLWAHAPWVTDPTTAAQVEPDVVAQMAAGDLVGFVDGSERSGIRAALAPYLTLVRNTVTAHPDDPALRRAAARLLRRFDASEALPHAEHAETLDPGFESAIAVAMVHREMDQIDDALNALERASTYEPEKLTAHADAVDLLIGADRFDEAQSWAERGLTKDPTDLYLTATVQAIRFVRSRSAEDFNALIGIYHARPEDSREQGLIGNLIHLATQKTASRIVEFGPDGRKQIR